ncbi:MAG: cobalt-precorrin-5B (C(1))-methyltransferase CbiD [Desulfobacterales bacterium]|nr:cobalt-precorrin-5B (C(1))-methyltransferase CbiD [Desulfobacterales bacterium]
MKKELRWGFTTGACAAAAGKAALCGLMGHPDPAEEIDIPFPNGERHSLPISFVRPKDGGGEAGVLKDAGDDPDITHGALVIAHVDWDKSGDITFIAGEGIGTVTKKGLSIPPGEPAITPGPKAMIRAALREVTDRPVRITLSIPGGREMALKTYNPRLGIVNGLSVLGTTGRVRPFSCKALTCSIDCELNVAGAAGVNAPVLVPGHIGERSARNHLALAAEQLIEVGNEWGFVLARLARHPFTHALLWGHPGKLAKLADGQWDTHSSRSGPPLDLVRRIGKLLNMPNLEGHKTTEGLFAARKATEQHRLAEAVSTAIAHAASAKAAGEIQFSVALVNMAGDILGTYGDMKPWR